MRVVGIENIICDYYLYKNKIYINGGGTIANILVNLDNQKIPCKLIGYCGNDEQGNWILHSLKKTNIDINQIQMTSTRTKCFYVTEKKTSSICPFCQKKKKRYPNTSIKKISLSLKSDDYVLLKDFTKANIQLIKQLKNEIFLDISMTKQILYSSKEEIENYIFHRYKIINMNESVFLLLQKKLKKISSELLKQMKSELIIITKGKKGVEFFYRQHHYQFDIENPFLEVETNGCGDTFFSNIIFEILKNPFKVWTKTDFIKIFEESQKKVKIVIQSIGARNHIIPNQEIKKAEQCICDTFHRI